MSSVWEDNLKHFRNRLASSEPVPGGGSAAMVSAALGCGLLIMAVEIAEKREGVDPRISSIKSGLHELLEKISRHADEDVLAYETYIAARKLPKSTEEEIELRETALSSALEHATEAPFKAIKDGLLALQMGKEIAPLVHPGIASDVGAGAALLKGAIDASLFTLLSNIRLMKDATKKEIAYSEYEQLAEESSRLFSDIFKISADKLLE